MIIENIKCKNYKIIGNLLELIVSDTTLEDIKNVLFNKNQLHVYTDNLEENELVEIIAGYSQGVSIRDNLDNTYNVILKMPSTDIEKDLIDLKEEIDNALIEMSLMIASIMPGGEEDV